MWAQRDLNPRPIDYESTALTAELWARFFTDSKYKVICRFVQQFIALVKKSRSGFGRFLF